MSPPWKIMKLMAIMITTLYVSLLVLQTPCAALASWQVLLQSSHGQALPRKLKLLEEAFVPVTWVKGKEYLKGSSSYREQKADLSGKQDQHHKEQVVRHGSVGTRREWMEAGTDTSQYFTMDYSHVRRRPPIHNKTVPVGP